MGTTIKNTGLDYLIRDVGQAVMPIEEGWHELLLFDKMLYEKEFTVEEVTRAVVQVLQERIGTKLNEIAIETAVTEKAPIFKPEIEYFKEKKRIALFDHSRNKIAVSLLVDMNKRLYFRHRKVEYIHEGHESSVYYRRF